MPDNVTTEAVRYLLEQQELVRAPLRNDGVDVPLGPFSVGSFAPFSLPGQAFIEVGRLRFYVKRVSSILGFWISANVAPTGSGLTAQLRINGAVTGAIATIPAGSNVSPEVRPGATFLNPDDWITMDVTAVGSTLPGGDVVGHIELATGVT